MFGKVFWCWILVLNFRTTFWIQVNDSHMEDTFKGVMEGAIISEEARHVPKVMVQGPSYSLLCQAYMEKHHAAYPWSLCNCCISMKPSTLDTFGLWSCCGINMTFSKKGVSHTLWTQYWWFHTRLIVFLDVLSTSLVVFITGCTSVYCLGSCFNMYPFKIVAFL